MKFGLSGQHPYVGVSTTPDNLASETARGLDVDIATHAVGWNPSSTVFHEESFKAYHWQDWLILPHHAFLADFWFHPALEEFHIGLSADSPVWTEFPRGATFCAHTQTLVFAPHPPFRSCLGKHIATLSCATSGPLRCGTRLKARARGSVEEFASDNTSTEMCAILRESYYADAAITVFHDETNGTVLTRSGQGMIMPLTTNNADAHIIDDVLLCGLPETYLENATANVGLLGTGLSFVYEPESGALHIHETRSNSMRDNWYDVIIINACLLLLVHFIFDYEKNVLKAWTYVPEVTGSLAAAAGLYFQKNIDGAYYRIADLEFAQLGVVLLTWWAAIMLAAHFAAMLLTVEGMQTTEDSDTSTEGVLRRIKRVRIMSFESSVLSSVFLQVLSGSLDILDAYMAFMVGTLLVYNTAYRCAEMAQRGNHPIIVFMAVLNLAAACFAFYVCVSAPAMDPVASLSSFVVESSVLVLQTTLLLALIESGKRAMDFSSR